MNIQPHLTGDRLELRPLAKDDYAQLFDAASDPKIWEQHPQSDRYKPEVFKVFFDEALASQGAMVIVDRATRKIIGTTRFYDYSKDQSSIVIGYTFIMKTYWGGDFNLELKKLVINYALQFVRTTLFQVGLNNIRSQKAMLKIGAVNTGIQEVVISYGPPKKSYIYKIEKPL